MTDPGPTGLGPYQWMDPQDFDIEIRRDALAHRNNYQMLAEQFETMTRLDDQWVKLEGGTLDLELIREATPDERRRHRRWYRRLRRSLSRKGH